MESATTPPRYEGYESDCIGDASQLVERTRPGKHTEVLKHFLHTVAMDSSILDLACGSGAWMARLLQHGYRDVRGVDSDVTQFALDARMAIRADLDQPFVDIIGDEFEVITAIEIIEHLESPANFLRQARRLVRPGGHLFLTTPNPECIQGRLRFLLQGVLRGFEIDGTGDPTHITPVFSSLLPRLAERTGWTIEERIPLLTDASRPHVRLVCRALRPFLSGVTDGDGHLFILRPRG